MSRVRVKTSLYSDPEFTGLTSSAQVLWFSRICDQQKKSFDVLYEMDRCRFETKEEVLEAFRELKASSYGWALRKVIKRQKINPELRQAIYERDGWACIACGARGRLEIDHIYPISRGGSDEPDNLQTMCPTCNRRKSNKVQGV